MKILFGKTKNSWNSVVYSANGRVTVSLNMDGRIHNICFDSIEDFSIQQQGLFDKSAKWVVSIPDRDCIFREISLPAANLDEALKMIQYELPGLIPIDPKKLVWGCLELAQRAESIVVGVCIIKKCVLDVYLDTLKKINITPDRVIIQSLAIKELFSDEKKCSVVISDDDSAVVVKFNQGSFPLSKYFKIDSQVDFSEKALKYLSLEEPGERLYLSLAPQVEACFKTQLTAVNFHESHECEISDFSEHSFEEREMFSGLVSTGAIIFCERNSHNTFNLMPQAEIKKRERKKALTSYAVNAAGVLVLIFMLWLNLCFGNIRLAKTIKAIDAQIAPIKDAAAQVSAKKIQLNAIKEQISSKGKIIKILDDF